MTFKSDRERDEFNKAPSLLKIVAERFADLSRTFGVEPVVTRILEPVDGESGVHRDYRAIDFRDEFNGSFLYRSYVREAILAYINALFHRTDSKQTIIWHSFNSGPYHFHIQIPLTTKILWQV